MLSLKLQTSISHCLFCVPTQISLETSPTFPKRNSAFPIAVKGNALPPVPTPLFLWNPLSNHLTLTADLQNVSRIQPFFTKLCLSHHHPLPNHYKSLLTVLPASAPAPYSPCQQRSRMFLLKLKSCYSLPWWLPTSLKRKARALPLDPHCPTEPTSSLSPLPPSAPCTLTSLEHIHTFLLQTFSLAISSLWNTLPPASQESSGLILAPASSLF